MIFKLRNKTRKITKSSLFIIMLWVGIFFLNYSYIVIALSLLILMWFERYLKIKIPTSFSIFFVIFVIFALVLWERYDFYHRYDWWDSMLHFSYGVAFSVIWFLIIGYIYHKKWYNDDIFLMVAFSFAVAVGWGSIWEIFEYSVDEFLNFDMQKARDLCSVWVEYCDTRLWVQDTMSDIILETTSALITNIYIYLYLRWQKDNWIWKIVDKFMSLNSKNPVN